jgi:hypothetical protein
MVELAAVRNPITKEKNPSKGGASKGRGTGGEGPGGGVKGGVFFSFLFFHFFGVLPPFLGGGWSGVAMGYQHLYFVKP